MNLPYSWGVQPYERELEYPCDRLIEESNKSLAIFRGISIKADYMIIYRWLCQLRIASYSYDLISNFGKKSPRTILPNQPDLSVGQTIVDWFEIIGYSPGLHITASLKKNIKIPFIKDAVISYLIIPKKNECRLILKDKILKNENLLSDLFILLFTWGDLLLSKKQLNTFKFLSEDTPS